MRNSALLLASMALAVLLACGVALAATGDLDRTFSGDGRVTTNIGDVEEMADLIVQPDGKLVAAGFRTAGDDRSDFALLRFDRDGSLSETFAGGDGFATTSFGPGRYEEANTLVRQPDGKLVAGGYTVEPVDDVSIFALVRYNQNGSLDRSFGERSKVTTDFPDEAFPASGETINDLIVQPDGKIVAAGWRWTGDTDGKAFALARYDPDGSPDESFGGGDGMVSTTLSAGSDGSDVVEALALQPDGKLVAAGTADGEFALVRYNPGGTLDKSFGGGDGIVKSRLSDRWDEVRDLVIRPDGKLIAAGSRSGFRVFALVRYNPDGTPDPNFGGDGQAITQFSDSQNYAKALVLQPDGKVVAAGFSVLENNYSVFALARFNLKGRLDRSFGGGDGKVTTNFGLEGRLTGFDGANALALQPDGKLVAAGQADTLRRQDSKVALARYLP